ncbi:MAG: hypothetical protein HQM08_16735 [Candidatus Riflebacteria bacterium]|nr:hypothetical protein [Candidatus Riflebacteria bacterium]
MSNQTSTYSRTSTVRELMRFLWIQKHWWLFPMVSSLLILGLISIVAQTSALSPLLYSIF